MAHIACAEDSMMMVEEEEAPPEEEGGLLPPSLQVKGSVAHKEPSPKPAGT